MLKKLISENLYKWDKKRSAPPTQISITPTNLCNLQCKSCWQRDEVNQPGSCERPAEIPEQKLCQIIREASELGVCCVELTGGGEPLARKQTTTQLIKEIKSRGLIGWMTSNGTLFSPDLIRLMIELGWDKLTLSLDGPDAKTNDFLRPPAGSFGKIINVLSLFNEYKKLLNKDKPEITFNVVVSKFNINKLSEIICLATKYAVGGVTFEPIKILSRECNELLVDFEKEYGRMMEELEKAQVIASNNNIFTNIDGLMRTPELIKYSGKLLTAMPIKKFDGRESKLLDVPCIEPWFHVYLEADGNVRPCCVSTGFGENIYNKTLKDIWFGEKFSSFRNAIIRKDYPLSCNQCNANLICFSREIQELLKEKLSISEQHFAKGETKTSQKQERIRMLITDTAPLYPPLWGGPKRIWGLYSNLAQDLFDITYVGTDFNIENNARYSFKRIRQNFKEILCAPPSHYYLWHAIERRCLKNLSLDLFFYLGMHTDNQFNRVLNTLDSDIIICSHPWSSLCLTHKSKLFIYDAHNCEYMLMKQILGRHPLRHLILRQIYKVEQVACNKSNFILVCSDREKEDLINLYKLNSGKFITISNGTESKEIVTLQKKETSRGKLNLKASDKVVIFVGANYKPNIEAFKFIVYKISPLLQEYKFLIAGTVCDPFRAWKLPENMLLLGKITEDILDMALSASDLAVNPMFEGSGINIKMLDYMSYGLPIVTTECGARGIEVGNKRPMIVSTAEKFSENIKALISDLELCRRLAQDGLSLAAERYDWRGISAILQDAIMQRLK